MRIIKGNNMNLSFDAEIIFSDAEFYINDADKVGIVGVNGAGKTTLFKLLLGEKNLDSGSIYFSKKRMGYLPQEIIIEDESMTVLEFLQEGRPIKKTEAKLEAIYEALLTATGEEQTKLLKKMGHLQDLLESYDCYNAENILFSIIESMSIDIDLLDHRIKDLSGGQKSAIAFAKMLYSNPDILLLDEPTNHLDVTTKEYVINYLKNYKGTVLIISHDIEFVNSIVNKIMFVDKVTHKILMYEGNYFTYQKKFAEAQRNRDLLISRQEKEIKDLSEFVQRAKQASITNHGLKRMGLERAAILEKRKKELLSRIQTFKRIKMRITPFRQGGNIPLAVEKLSFNYPGQPPLYHDLTFKLKSNERFLVVGENGVGKSTLLKLIMGILKPISGDITFHEKTDVAYYAQELEQLDESKTIWENVQNGSYLDFQVRAILSNFLFYDLDINKSVEVLSPGEKARVALCKVIMQKANLLVLDEPTNHLDPETQKIIGGNFNQFEGTIIVVSHNPTFVEQIGISRMLILPTGRIENYSRELLEYYYDINNDGQEEY